MNATPRPPRTSGTSAYSTRLNPYQSTSMGAAANIMGILPGLVEVLSSRRYALRNTPLLLRPLFSMLRMYEYEGASPHPWSTLRCELCHRPRRPLVALVLLQRNSELRPPRPSRVRSPFTTTSLWWVLWTLQPGAGLQVLVLCATGWAAVVVLLWVQHRDPVRRGALGDALPVGLSSATV